MQALTQTCGRSAADSKDPKCRLKSSQHTLNFPHREIQLTTISFWVPDKLAPPASQQIGEFPLKWAKYQHHHPFSFLPQPQESSLCSGPIRSKVHWTGRIFPEHAEWSFLDPKHSFTAVGWKLQTRFVKQKFAQLRINYGCQTFSGSMNISQTRFVKQKFTQARMGLSPTAQNNADMFWTWSLLAPQSTHRQTPKMFWSFRSSVFTTFSIILTRV